MIHQAHAFMNALADDGACRNRAVEIEELDPVVVDDASLVRVRLRYPDDRPSPRQSQHQQIISICRMDAPFLVWCDEVEDNFCFTVAAFAKHFGNGARIDRRPINCEAFAEIAEPAVVLIELLATA